jgi:hypothetical protein
MSVGWAVKLPHGSCSRRPLHNAAAVAAWLPLLVMLALQAPRLVLGDAPVVAGKDLAGLLLLLACYKATVAWHAALSHVLQGYCSMACSPVTRATRLL